VFGTELKFTYWGILGASVWVINGTVAIVAVQKCGLSTAQTLWSGLSVFVGFLWGTIVFEEEVRDIAGSMWALAAMSAGMGSMGMVVSQSSSSSSSSGRRTESKSSQYNRGSSFVFGESETTSGSSRSSSVSPIINGGEGGDDMYRNTNDDDVEMNTANNVNNNSSNREFAAARERLMMGTTSSSSSGGGNGGNGMREFDDLSKASTNPFGFRTTAKNHRSGGGLNLSSSSAEKKQKDVKIGILCATYVGIANGSFMTPLKYANKEVTGLEYLFSFGVGSALATVVLVFLYNLYRRQINRDFSPLNFHFETCAKPALLTGVLWSAGNACSIVAISRLGVAVGWPLVQCQLVVSTSWGVWYYREVRGRKAIAGFFASAAFVLFGVIMLGNCSR
jgi:glucose uptake protein GlcU